MGSETLHRRADDADNVVLKVIEHVDLKLMVHQRQTAEWLAGPYNLTHKTRFAPSARHKGARRDRPCLW